MRKLINNMQITNSSQHRIGSHKVQSILSSFLHLIVWSERGKGRMKQLGTVWLLVLISLLSFGCKQSYSADDAKNHEDGVYRGVFIDRASIQINVEIKLEDGVVTDASFRHLRRDDDYHLTTEEEPYRSVVQQYKEALGHLIGKNLEVHLNDLYTPDKIVSTEVEMYTSATLRSNKIISAIRDALNRGVYSY